MVCWTNVAFQEWLENGEVRSYVLQQGSPWTRSKARRCESPKVVFFCRVFLTFCCLYSIIKKSSFFWWLETSYRRFTSSHQTGRTTCPDRRTTSRGAQCGSKSGAELDPSHRPFFRFCSIEIQEVFFFF